LGIIRTSREEQKKYLRAHPHLKILDIGCSCYTYSKEANHYADIADHSPFFRDKNLPFTRIYPNQKLPFDDHAFDYVILSHVLEHVDDVMAFAAEIMRIAKCGYIELPTKLADNLIFGCDQSDMGDHGHKWWFEFDDVAQCLRYTQKIDAIEKFLTVGQAFKLRQYFDDSLTIQLYWQDDIPLQSMEVVTLHKKIAFATFVRKYVSKRLRILMSHGRAYFKS
jgi:SAM-dependent methyltransferase